MQPCGCIAKATKFTLLLSFAYQTLVPSFQWYESKISRTALDVNSFFVQKMSGGGDFLPQAAYLPWRKSW